MCEVSYTGGGFYIGGLSGAMVMIAALTDHGSSFRSFIYIKATLRREKFF